MKTVKRVVFLIVVVLAAALYSYGVWPRAIYNTDIGAGSYENTGTLTAERTFEQRFTCSDTGFCNITVKLMKQGSQEMGTYEWILTEVQSGEEVGRGIIDEASTENKEFVSSNVQKRGNITLSFPAQKDSAGREYLLTIQGPEEETEGLMAVYVTEKGKSESTLLLNGEDQGTTSVIKLGYHRFNVETFIVFLALVGYVVLFVKFMYKLFR